MRWRNTIIITALLGMAAVLSSGQAAEAATASPIIYAKTVWTLPYPDGKVSGGLFAASGEQKWQLTDHPRDREPSVSRDRSTIVFVREGDLYAMAADGSGQRQLTSGPELDELPRVSPDGGLVLFVRRSELQAPGDLYTVPLVGGDPSPLAPFSGDDREASFSPEGRVIVFVRSLPLSEGGTNEELFSVRPDGSGLIRLTRTAADEVFPRYFARGIVFNRRQGPSGGRAGIYAMRRNGTRVRAVLIWKPRLRVHVKAVSPNGRLLVFSTGSGDTWVKRLVGPTRRSLRPRRLAHGTAEHLVFSPDGRRIAGAFANTSSEVSPFYVLSSIDVSTGVGQGAIESWEPEEGGPTQTGVGSLIAW